MQLDATVKHFAVSRYNFLFSIVIQEALNGRIVLDVSYICAQGPNDDALKHAYRPGCTTLPFLKGYRCKYWKYWPIRVISTPYLTLYPADSYQ